VVTETAVEGERFSAVWVMIADVGDDRRRRGGVLKEEATDVHDRPHAGHTFGQPLKLDVDLAVSRRGRDLPAGLGLRVLGDRYGHVLERMEHTRADLRHRVAEGPVGDAVHRVLDPGATGHTDGRQRGDRAALEQQASKQNCHHWRTECAHLTFPFTIVFRRFFKREKVLFAQPPGTTAKK